MRLVPQEVQEWPKLAWVARFAKDVQGLQVLHGPMVEVSDSFAVEAVWAGDFGDGDFDQTELVFGTGIRLRNDHVVFVSSGSVFDRLLYCECDGIWHFSNSLPALLATAQLSLRDDYLHYSRDARSITKGLDNRVCTIPTNAEDVRTVFYNNLVFDGQGVTEQPKVDTAPHFECFDGYYDYLTATAHSLGGNASSPDRRHQITPLASISSGYDSCATAVISRHAGCERTVTIKESSSFWRGSDSGAHVAEVLGMSCKEYSLNPTDYPMEEAIWAAEGRPGILNWSQFDYPEPLCVFFTGCHGEKMWDRVNHDHPDPFVRRDPSSLGFCEFRLLKGVFQCPMPFWGIRHSHELRAITESEEMRPWYMHRDYEKPIARRIVEGAGVPRRAFGVLNKNTSLEKPFWWPRSHVAKGRFRDYLRERDVFAPSDFSVKLIGAIAQLDGIVYRSTLKKMGIPKGSRPWSKMAACSLVFKWANDQLKQNYLNGLCEILSETNEWSDSVLQ